MTDKKFAKYKKRLDRKRQEQPKKMLGFCDCKFFKSNGCAALKVKDCALEGKCSFYKTNAQYEKELEKVALRHAKLGIIVT